jgi:hypothetical protein
VTARRVEIMVDVRVDDGEITGEARDAVGRCRPFLGWLGLIGALDGLLEDTPDRPSPAGPDGPDGTTTYPPHPKDDQ